MWLNHDHCLAGDAQHLREAEYRPRKVVESVLNHHDVIALVVDLQSFSI
jgi:hypothetical protein